MRVCWLIFDQGDLDDVATLEALTPSHDAESGQRQAYGQVVGDVPAFPDTQRPVLYNCHNLKTGVRTSGAMEYFIQLSYVWTGMGGPLVSTRAQG